MLWIAVVTVLAGCGSGEISPRENGLDGLQLQARDALARYDQVILDAGGQQQFVPVGNLTGRLGDWEPTNEDVNGRCYPAGSSPPSHCLPYRTGQARWSGRAGRARRSL